MSTKKKVILIIAAVLVVGIAIAAFFVIRHNSLYISADEALQIAIADSGVNTATIIGADAEFENNGYSTTYEVEIEAGLQEYKYLIDAKTGEILGSTIEND